MLTDIIEATTSTEKINSTKLTLWNLEKIEKTKETDNEEKINKEKWTRNIDHDPNENIKWV